MKSLLKHLVIAAALVASVHAGNVISGIDPVTGNVIDAKTDLNKNILTSNAPSGIPTNTVSVSGLTTSATTNVIVIESGPVKKTIVNRLTIYPGAATADGFATITISRNTVAATASGTLVTGTTMQHDQSDTVFTGIVRTGSFTVTGVTTTPTAYVIVVAVPISTTSTPMPPIVIDFTNSATQKGLVIPIGITNGLMFTYSGVSGQTSLGMSVDFTEQ